MAYLTEMVEAMAVWSPDGPHQLACEVGITKPRLAGPREDVHFAGPGVPQVHDNIAGRLGTASRLTGRPAR
jgi:hypothetical protein